MVNRTLLLSATAAALLVSFHPSTDAGVFANVPEAAEEGYLVLYELYPPVDSGFRNSAPVPYATDHSSEVPPFDRVAYYLELTGAEGTRWVYVSFEAFSDQARHFGLPHNLDNPVVHQRNVRNMNVASNHPDILTGTFLDTGHIEIWPSNYLPRDTFGVFEASDEFCDWGDGGGSDKAGYGSFQIHNPMARQTLLAFNGFSSISTTPVDIGIGNQPTGHPDWTGAHNAGDYSARKLVVLVRPRSFEVAFEAWPRDRQLFARDPATNRAAVTIAGEESFGGHQRALLRIFRDGLLHRQLEQELTYTGGRATFFFEPDIEAELAGYDFELWLQQHDQLRLVDRVRGIVAGDAYLFYGQSNAVAMSYDPLRSANDYASRWLRTFGYSGDNGAKAGNILYWMEAEGDGGSGEPGAIGQWAMVFGRALIDARQVPVAILNGARGGYSIDRLQKDRDQPDNLHDTSERRRPYNRLRYRAIQAGIAGHARALFYYQGEHDFNDADAHAAGFATLHQDWLDDYPGLQQIYLTQVRPGCGVTASRVALREVQRRFADLYPNLTVVASNALPGHDGCHYLLAGHEQLAWHHFRLVDRDLYGGVDGPDLDALNPARVAFTDPDRTQLKIILRNHGATVHFPPAALSDFAIADSTAKVISRSVSGHTLHLQLDRPVPADSILEYRGHLSGGEWITNANGAGLLSFAETVRPDNDLVVLLPLADTVVDADVGDPVIIEASAVEGPAGPVSRIILYANGVPQAEVEGAGLEAAWQAVTAGAYRITVRAIDSAGNESDASFTVLAGAPAAPGGVSTGLKVWLKAESGVTRGNGPTVVEWRDQSGNDHHATQPDESAAPHYVPDLYGLGPGLRFNGAGFLTSPSGMPTGDYTKIVRFIIAEENPSLNNNLVSSPEAGTSSNRDHALFVPGLKPALFHSELFAQSDQEVSPHRPALVVATYDASTGAGKIHLDRQLTGSGTAPGANTKTGYQIGAYRTPASHFLHGSVAEVILYDRVLNEEERTAIEEYLETKFLTPFQRWQRPFLPSAGEDPSDQDSDQDGLPDLLEYALGLEPAIADAPLSGRLPRIEVEGGNAAVVYRRALDRPDVMLQLERSADLVTWAAVTDEAVATDGAVETRRHSISLAGGQVFFRLRATVPGAPP